MKFFAFTISAWGRYVKGVVHGVLRATRHGEVGFSWTLHDLSVVCGTSWRRNGNPVPAQVLGNGSCAKTAAPESNNLVNGLVLESIGPVLYEGNV